MKRFGSPHQGSDAKPVRVEPCRSLAIPIPYRWASSRSGAYMVAVQAVLLWGGVERHHATISVPELWHSILFRDKFEKKWHQRVQPVIAAQHSAVRSSSLPHDGLRRPPDSSTATLSLILLGYGTCVSMLVTLRGFLCAGICVLFVSKRFGLIGCWTVFKSTSVMIESD